MTKTKQFVLDANTLISAFLLAKTSIAASAFYKASAEGIIVLSNETYAEFSDVFSGLNLTGMFYLKNGWPLSRT